MFPVLLAVYGRLAITEENDMRREFGGEFDAYAQRTPPNARRIRRELPKLLTLLRQFVQSPAQALANTLMAWLEPIVGMWRYSTSNGITEGFHTKMEMMSRRAFGFRNFENYLLRVLAHCGWGGVINRI